MAPSRRARASVVVAGPLRGFIALLVFAFGKPPVFTTRLNSSVRAIGRTKKGSVTNFVEAPAIMFADSSIDRATCSTIWLGDHFPGAHGAVQDALHRSDAAMRSLTAS